MDYEQPPRPDANPPGDRGRPPQPSQPPLSHQGSRPPRPVRDTVIMYKADMFENLGVQDMPVPEFEELAALIANHFGIKVGENKRTLVTGRIHPMMEKYGFATHRECLEAIKRDRSGELVSELANRISTNHTAFFREESHFAYLRETLLPELVAKKTKTGDLDLRIWCAACATGEEAYTILFTLLKFFGYDYKRWRAGLLATDISAEALEKARLGIYSRQRIEAVPRDMVNMYFDQIDADTFEVKPDLREEVTFRRLNLNNETYPLKRPFDMIFCRNVMIYFSRTIRMRLLDRLHDWLVPGGVLFVGHSESLVGSHSGLEYIAPALYARSD